MRSPTLENYCDTIDSRFADDVKDPINNPEHYTHGGIECIDAMIETQGTYTVACFCLCNAFKYLWRHNHKDNSMEDVLKAQWYLNKYVDLMTVGEVRDGR